MAKFIDVTSGVYQEDSGVQLCDVVACCPAHEAYIREALETIYADSKHEINVYTLSAFEGGTRIKMFRGKELGQEGNESGATEKVQSRKKTPQTKKPGKVSGSKKKA